MKNSLILILFLLFAIGVFADTDGPISVSVMEGDSVTLNSGLTAIQSKGGIEWRFKENRIAKISSSESNEISVWISPDGAFLNSLQLNNQTGDLKITNIKTTNSGQYTVKIKSSSGSSDMTLIVKVSADAEMPVSVMVGDSVTLQTDPTKIQRDDFSILWMFGDKLIAKIPKKQEQFIVSDGIFTDRLKLNNQTGSLTITNIRTTDSGVYQLEISSSRFTINRRINVTVTDDVKSVSVTEDDSVTLHTGLTKIQTDDEIRWTFKDKFIADLNNPVNEKYNIHLDHQTGDLISSIRWIQYGDYKVEIKTRRMILHRKYPITLIDGPKSVSVKEGDSVTLHTDTEIQNDDLIQWMFGDIRLAVIDKALQRHPIYSDGTFRDRLKLDHQTGSLNITNTRTTDSGLYELRISSNRRIINRRFTVTVIAASGSGLATGIAIGVGVVVGVGVLLVAVYCWWSKRGKPARTVKYNAGTTLNGTQDSNGPAN